MHQKYNKLDKILIITNLLIQHTNTKTNAQHAHTTTKHVIIFVINVRTYIINVFYAQTVDNLYVHNMTIMVYTFITRRLWFIHL